MYPAPTSLIPATVALLRFYNQNGLNTFNLTYPYWYLGSTPVKYLIGPVVPMIEYIIHRLLPGVSVFNILLLLILVSVFLGAVGWVLVIRLINGAGNKISRLSYFLIFFIFLLAPWKFLSALAFDEGTAIIARSLIPFVIVLVWPYLLNRRVLNLYLSALFLALLLLINTNILLTSSIIIAVLCLTASYKNGKTGFPVRKIKRGITVILAGIVISTFWYTPLYWYTLAANPGIGGSSAVPFLYKLIEFIKNLGPIMAVFVVFAISKIKAGRIEVFSLIFTSIFALLTLFRFIANPEFWTDWVGWFVEIEYGLCLLASVGILKGYRKLLLAYLISIFTVFIVYLQLGSPKLLSSTIPVNLKGLELVKNIKNGRVYITGTYVFWTNAFVDIYQIRGGRDEVAVSVDWRRYSYVLRESRDVNKIREAIKESGIDYVILNTTESRDFYKDYKNLEVWDLVGSKAGELKGDLLIKVN